MKCFLLSFNKLFVDMLTLFQDDLIDDVESFVVASQILKERGAYKIYVMATHGLLSADAPRRLEDSDIDEVSIHIFYLLSVNF